MDLESSNDDESEETCIEDEDYNIDSMFEQERCGICIDIVIDRGMLDCCDHWFCFACIDNWAAITNFCPMCKNEFQLITCLPVYDTVRSITLEEHPLSRNDDWSIQGKNNALSFPSYYISEDAVKCLGHHGCKIHTLQGTEDLCFDTSIACDSCDIWYHALCVGFNPQFTSENSWLCPRCINNEVLQKPDAVSSQSPVKYSASQTTKMGWTIDPSLSGKVSVSVADTGETAVVVSMIAEKQKEDCEITLFGRLDSSVDLDSTKSPSSFDDETPETALLPKDGSCIQVSQNNFIFSDSKEHCTNPSNIDNRSEMFFDMLPEIIDFKPYGDLKEATVSPFSHDAAIIKPSSDVTELQSPPTLQDVPFSLCYSEADDEGKNINSLETRSDSVYSSGYIDTSFMPPCTSECNVEQEKSSGNTVTCLAATSTSSADNVVTSCNKEMPADICQKSMDSCNSTAELCMNKAYKINMDENNGSIRKSEQEDVFPAKKLKLERKFKALPTENQSNFSVLDGSQVCTGKMKEANLTCARQEGAEVPDIMSIVHESERTSHVMPTEMKTAKNLINKKDGTCGLRVKKIMRRAGEKRESSILAEELGEEIREVVQKKTSKGDGKNDFDGKLLAAFRAAIITPPIELARSERVLAGSKKHLPVKGKKRENLTKKIYRTSNGRRRHAWARDLEIEFWKHRCRSTQYEKVETLQSVLELLKKATNPNWNSFMECNSQEESANSILSRVYVADASVFPRKDDIKPLSAASGSSHVDNHDADEEKSLKKAVKVTLNDNKSVMKGSSGENFNWKANSGSAVTETIQSLGSNSSKEYIATSKERSYPLDARSDKRKWALEVLARKTASANINVNKGQENVSLLKGNYPLLAQLPQDMRPMLATTRHNKVSASIRQNQLYRITEHYLRRANLTVIRRTAETELAVADAVNVEKEILEKSNSKLVYVNLCSLAVSQVAKIRESDVMRISSSLVPTSEADETSSYETEVDNKPESAETNISSILLPISEFPNEVPGETNYDTKAPGWSNMEEALKLPGLFCDSPPSSSYYVAKDSNEDEILNFEKPESAETNASSTTLPISEISNEVSGETKAVSNACGWSNVEEALKMAGLFSDSPPSSPYCAKEVSNEDKCAQKNVDGIMNCDAHCILQHSKDTERNASTTQNCGKAVCNCINMKVELPLYFSNSLEQQKECRTENCNTEINMDICLPTISEEPLLTGEEKTLISSFKGKNGDDSMIETNSYISDPDTGPTLHEISAGGEKLETQKAENLQSNPVICDNIHNEDIAKSTNDKSDLTISISKKVEAYVKEHVRPLCRSGVITAGQYRWAVGKTSAKVMKFHRRARNANFLIREGENVKKLAEKYVEAAQKQRFEVDKMSR